MRAGASGHGGRGGLWGASGGGQGYGGSSADATTFIALLLGSHGRLGLQVHGCYWELRKSRIQSTHVGILFFFFWIIQDKNYYK